jgi:ribA/ribD-fused uncharacterized protein
VILFDHPIWKHVAPFAKMVAGRDNVDLLQLPDDLRVLAVDVVCNCVSCGAVIHPLRCRAKSDRSRVAGTAVERRLFYAATCPSEMNPGCSRTTAAQEHKEMVRRRFTPDAAQTETRSELIAPPPPPINSFSGEHRFLSNFWQAPIIYGGIVYPSTEHAYQAAKSLNPEVRQRIASLATSAMAKDAGKNAVLRPDWESVKIGVMRDVLRLKFMHADLREKLLATAGRELIEGNHWHDRFWGVCDGRGENHLGRLLMEIRAELLPQRLLITGSRDWIDEAPITAEISQLPRGSVVIHGGAKGADAIADRVARFFGFTVEVYEADWERLGKRAGIVRNQEMLSQSRPTRAAAFPLPQSVGTNDMIRRCRKAGVPIKVRGGIK